MGVELPQKSAWRPTDGLIRVGHCFNGNEVENLGREHRFCSAEL